MTHRIFTTPLADVYSLYAATLERKGRSKRELHQVIHWLTGHTEASLKKHLAKKTTFEDFFAAARMNPKSKLITGSVCGVKVQGVSHPLMKKSATSTSWWTGWPRDDRWTRCCGADAAQRGRNASPARVNSRCNTANALPPMP